MPLKMILIREDLYRKLLALKGHKRSFSDVVEELLNTSIKDPLAHFGIGKDEDPKDQDDFERYLFEYKEKRKKNRMARITQKE